MHIQHFHYPTYFPEWPCSRIMINELSLLYFSNTIANNLQLYFNPDLLEDLIHIQNDVQL